jgi:cytoskeletal protein RodZ
MNASNGRAVIVDGLGECLRRERELRHISLDDVAERTKISRRYLEAIEEGHYDRLPGETFARGFIRSYAQSVGLDPEDILLMYAQTRGLQEPLPQRAERSLPTRRSRNARSLQWLLLAGVVVVGAVLVGIVGVLEGPNLLRFTATPRDNVGTAPTVGVRAGGVPLILTAIADADTWLRVIVDDQEVQDMLLRAGQSAKWLGQERFVVSIGNAHATRLQLNGRELAIPPAPQSVIRHYLVSRETLR